MKASARFEQDDSHFQELYEEWLRYGSKVRRWQPWIGISSCVLGVGLFFLAPYMKASSFVLVFFGIVQVIENRFYRRKWVAARVAARSKNEHNEIYLEFDENGISLVGPTSTGKMIWTAVVGVRETSKGISLAIGDGMSMYIPKAAVVPADAIPDIVKYARRGA